MKFKLIPVEMIDVPEEYPVELDAIADDRDYQSIRENGVQQHLAVIGDGKRYALIDGARRLRFAGMLSLDAVPCDVHEAPEGEDADAWRRTMRVVLNFHRQDLVPSQKAEMASEVKRLYGLTEKQLGEKCGVDARTVRNWIAVKSFLPEIKEGLDAGRMSVASTRVFVGLNEEGQRYVLKTHRKDFETLPPGKLHKVIRATIPPGKRPELYANPTRALGFRKAKMKVQRAGKSRSAFSKAQKQTLLNDFETREIEIRRLRMTAEKLEASIPAALAIVPVILRNEDLITKLSEEQLTMLAAFSEVVV